MKKLIVVRHAKAADPLPGVADFDRPLMASGETDALTMARILVTGGTLPGAILSSPAVRALTTARILAGAIGFDPARIELRAEIYQSNAADLLRLLQSVSDSWSQVAVVGHNPELSELVNGLGGEAVGSLPTCGVAVLEFEVDRWMELAGGLGRLARFEYPKLHR